jgi:hypothetical protein
MTLPPMVATALSWPQGPNPFAEPAQQPSIHDTDLAVFVGVDSTPLCIPCTLPSVIPSRHAEGMHPGALPDSDDLRQPLECHIWSGGPGGFTGRDLQHMLSSMHS